MTEEHFKSNWIAISEAKKAGNRQSLEDARDIMLYSVGECQWKTSHRVKNIEKTVERLLWFAAGSGLLGGYGVAEIVRRFLGGG